MSKFEKNQVVIVIEQATNGKKVSADRPLFGSYGRVTNPQNENGKVVMKCDGEEHEFLEGDLNLAPDQTIVLASDSLAPRV